MAQTINIATELDDKSFHFTRTSVYSFLQHNPWFNGTIYYLVASENSVSSQNLILIQKIYSKIELLKVESVQNPEFLILSKKEPIFYFKNCSLFTKNIKSIFEINRSLVDPNLNFLFKYEEQALAILEYQSFNSTFYINCNQILDKKFNQLSNLMVSHAVILFDSEPSANTSKIHQIWLQKNREALLYSEKPINISRIDKIESSHSGTLAVRPKSLEKISHFNPATQKIIQSINKTHASSIFEDYHTTLEYFANKSICLVANSSELLEYEYGELIDSHDIIIRFNGYKIVEKHTGNRTDIHCVFRDFQITHQYYIDYKVVISKNVNLWANAISKYHATDAVNRKYKLLDFS